MTHDRPAEVDAWVNDEVSRIWAMYADAVEVSSGDLADVLFTVRDPAGCGWTGSARLDEVRVQDAGVEFTVFFSARPPSRRRPAVHLWGVDVRYQGQRVSLATDSSWQDHRSGGPPALQNGIERLIRGDFRPSAVWYRTRRTVAPYGT